MLFWLLPALAIVTPTLGRRQPGVGSVRGLDPLVGFQWLVRVKPERPNSDPARSVDREGSKSPSGVEKGRPLGPGVQNGWGQGWQDGPGAGGGAERRAEVTSWRWGAQDWKWDTVRW